MKIRWMRFVLPLALVFICFGAGVLRDSIQKNKTTGIFVSDFIAYWGGYQIAAAGKNPYDLKLLQTLKAEIGYERKPEEGYVFWYFPWFLVLFSPFLIWSFETSAILWLICNLLVFCWICALSWKLFVSAARGRLFLIIGSGLVLVPVSYAIKVGQISLWVTLGAIGVVWCLENKRDRLAGLFLILTTFKPHLMHLFYPACLLWSYQNKRWKPLAYAAAYFLVLQGVTFCLYPDLYALRVELKAGPFDVAAATIETMLRLQIYRSTGHLVVWPAWVIAISAMLFFILYFARHSIHWKSHLGPIFIISLITIIHGGIADFSLLIIAQISLVGAMLQQKASKRLQIFGMGILVCFHFISLIIFIFLTQNLHEMWWYPSMYGLVCLLIYCRMNNYSGPEKPDQKIADS